MSTQVDVFDDTQFRSLAYDVRIDAGITSLLEHVDPSNFFLVLPSILQHDYHFVRRAVQIDGFLYVNLIPEFRADFHIAMDSVKQVGSVMLEHIEASLLYNRDFALKVVLFFPDAICFLPLSMRVDSDVLWTCLGSHSTLPLQTLVDCVDDDDGTKDLSFIDYLDLTPTLTKLLVDRNRRVGQWVAGDWRRCGPVELRFMLRHLLPEDVVDVVLRFYPHRM